MLKFLPRFKSGRFSVSSRDDSTLKHKDKVTSQSVVVSPRSTAFPATGQERPAEKASDPSSGKKIGTTDAAMPKVGDHDEILVYNDPYAGLSRATTSTIVADGTFSLNTPLRDALSLLSQKSNMKAGLHSAAREPPPRCHQGTRHELLHEISSGLEHADRNLLWLHGPAGAGKSAVAQSVAELWESQSGLCAAFFFSRTDERNDPTRVLPTFAHQLAVLQPIYRQRISRLLIEDPTVLEQTLSVQFQKLILEPLSHLRDVGIRPILFLLDGLDECRGHAFQQMFVTLITSAVQHRLPCIWVITSRPDRLLVSTFSHPNILINCRSISITLDASDADIHKYLRDRFARIRERYSDAFSEDEIWPTTAQLAAIIRAASGFFSFASAIVLFVENDQYHNPKTRLDVCLANLKGFPQQENPLQPLYDLYGDILSNLHPQVLRRVLQILYMRPDIPAQTVANFFFFDQAEFYGVFHDLHSVLDIPKPGFAARFPIKVFHYSFYHYLRYMVGHGYLGIGMGEVITDVETFCIRWCEIWRGLNEKPSQDTLLSHLRWPADPVQFSDVLGLVSEQIGWIRSNKIGETVPKMYEGLRRLVAHRSFVSSGEDWSENDSRFDSLHLLYSGILRTISQASLPIVRVLFLSRPLPAQSSANLLFLDQTAFYENIWKLHLVLDVPDPEDAERLPIRLRSSHVTFESYLDRVIRAGDLGVSEDDVLAYIEGCYNKWCSIWGELGSNPPVDKLRQHMLWPAESCYGDVLEFVSKELWKIWCSEIHENTPRFYKEFHRFDFAAHHRTGLLSGRIWPDPHQPATEVTAWLRQLNIWQSGRREFNILRLQPQFLTDQRLFKEYGYLIHYSGMKELDFRCLEAEPEWSYTCLSLEAQSTDLQFGKIRETLLNPLPMYFLLGHDPYTCLVIAHRPTLGVRQFLCEAFEQMRSVFPEATNKADVWPTPDDLEVILSTSTTSQELFIQAQLPSLARSIVAFVGNPEYADPVGRLRQVLDILVHHSDQTTILDLLRSQSLNDIPPHLRPIADQVFAFVICYGARPHHHNPLATQISLFLNVTEEIVKKILRMTNLVLSSRPLPFPMSAVSDFDLSDLLDYCTGGDTYVPKGSRSAHPSLYYGPTISPQTWSEISLRYIRWWDRLFATGLNTWARSDPPESQYQGANILIGEAPSRALEDLPSDYDPQEDHPGEEADMLFQRNLMAGGHWIAFSQIVKERAADIVAELQESQNFFLTIASAYNFSITHYDEMTTHFSSFINKLYSFQVELSLEPVVRLDRNCNVDDELLAKWKRLRNSCHKATLPIDFTQTTCYFITLAKNWSQEMLPEGTWYYFWLGHGRNTCLVTFQVENEGKSVTFSGEWGNSEMVVGEASKSMDEDHIPLMWE